MKTSYCRRPFYFILAIFFTFLTAAASFACSSIIIGKNASSTGSIIFGRTEDMKSYNAKRLVVFPKGCYKSGEVVENEYIKIKYGKSYSYTMTHDSYKFLAAPSMPVTIGAADDAPTIRDAFGTNEHGLAVSATNTTSLRDQAKVNGNDYGEEGIEENFITKILLSEAKTPIEAVELLGRIVERDGVGDKCGCLVMIANKDELWVFETIGRRRWVASKLPDDKFLVVANDMVTDYVDLSDRENYRGSPDAISFAVDNHFAIYGGPSAGIHSDDVNIAATYGTINQIANAGRRWRGYNLFAASRGIEFLTEDKTSVTYPMFVKPDKKITLSDAFAFQRDRYEGTQYDISELNRCYEYENGYDKSETSADTHYPAFVRPLGHNTQEECHVFEVAQSYPNEIGARIWLAMSQSEHSPHLPFYGAITDTHPFFKQLVNGVYYQNDSAFWIFQDIAFRARENRKMYGKPVQEYWKQYERKLADAQPAIESRLLDMYKTSPSVAREYINGCTINMSQRAFNRAGLIRKILIKHTETSPGELFTVPSELTPYVNADLMANDISEKEEKAVNDALGLPAGSAVKATRATTAAASDIAAADSPKASGCKVLSGPGISFKATLSGTENFSRVRFTYEIMGEDYAAFGNSIDNVRRYFAFFYGEKELVGPRGLISLQSAEKDGSALVIGDSESATVMIDLYIYDGTGGASYSKKTLAVPDGAADGYLTGEMWAFVKEHKEDTHGCNAGFAGLLLLTMTPFLLKKQS